MAKPTHLLQEIKGKKPFLYVWTPVLARKKDMRPLSEKQAKQFMDTGSTDDADAPEPDVVDANPYVSDDEEDEGDSSILDSLEPGSDKVSTVDGEARNLVVTQDDILKKEAETIGSLKKKASVEEYVLKKYKIELLPMDHIDEMKQQAVDLLSTLASTESLYE